MRVGTHARMNMHRLWWDTASWLVRGARLNLNNLQGFFTEKDNTGDDNSLQKLVKDMNEKITIMAGISPELLARPLREPRVSFLHAIGALDMPILSGREVGMRIQHHTLPPLFAPRDNNVEGTQEEQRTDRQKYTLLCATNEYVAPQAKRDRYGVPEWPEGTVLADGRHPDAGAWGKLCYRTACQQPNAFYFNTGSRKHYCRGCAKLINKENMLGEKLLHLAETEGEHA